ncbi:MAG: hypothetical protein ACHQQS_17520 [Thermoanaerobaculales bacterium]
MLSLPWETASRRAGFPSLEVVAIVAQREGSPPLLAPGRLEVESSQQTSEVAAVNPSLLDGLLTMDLQLSIDCCHPEDHRDERSAAGC